MLKLSRKTLSGSYRSLSARSRSSVAGGKASPRRSVRVSVSKLRYTPRKCRYMSSQASSRRARSVPEATTAKLASRRPKAVASGGTSGDGSAERADLEEVDDAGGHQLLDGEGELGCDVPDQSRSGDRFALSPVRIRARVGHHRRVAGDPGVAAAQRGDLRKWLQPGQHGVRVGGIHRDHDVRDRRLAATGRPEDDEAGD